MASIMRKSDAEVASIKFEIEISEEELKTHILAAAATSLHKDFSMERNMYQRIIAQCVREIIYKDKDEIVDRIVAQASRECGNKAVRKLLTQLSEDDHGEKA